MLDYGSQTKDFVNDVESLKGCLGLSEPYTYSPSSTIWRYA